jgi:hypothetical protein
MKLKLIAIVATALTLGATAAVADNNYVFDDPYWKRAETVQAVQPTQSALSMGETINKYEHVDGFNN